MKMSVLVGCKKNKKNNNNNNNNKRQIQRMPGVSCVYYVCSLDGRLSMRIVVFLLFRFLGVVA